MAKRFLRRVWDRHSKLGMRRKKKQKWRNPTGRDNKMREKRKGYPAVVSIGYRKSKEDRNKINGRDIVRVNNIKDLEKADKKSIIILGNVGKKKKIEILQKAKELNLEIYKTNPEKFIKNNKKEKKVKTSSKKQDKKTGDEATKQETKEKQSVETKKDNQEESSKEKTTQDTKKSKNKKPNSNKEQQEDKK